MSFFLPSHDGMAVFDKSNRLQWFAAGDHSIFGNHQIPGNQAIPKDQAIPSMLLWIAQMAW